MSELPRDPASHDIVPDDRVHAALRRAAQLQAEAAERLEQRTRALAGTTAAEAGSGGVTRAHLEAAAAEAGISPEYLRQALVEQDALGEHAAELAPWVERAANGMLRSRQRTIELSRTIRAAPADVLETMKRVLPAHPYLLTLVDLVGREAAARWVRPLMLELRAGLGEEVFRRARADCERAWRGPPNPVDSLRGPL